MTPVLRIARILLGALFLFAGMTKLVPAEHRYLFEMAVSGYRVMPAAMVPLFAWLLPLGEVVLGLFLLAERAPRFAASSAAILLFLFLGLSTSAWMRGMNGFCGCFGFGEPISRWTLARDGVLLLVALFVAFGSWRRRRMMSLAEVAAA